MPVLAEASQPPRPARVLKPQLEPRGQGVQDFPTWKPRPAPVAHLPERPIQAAAGSPRRLPALVLHAVAALALLAPLGWLLGWLGLPHSAAEFLMTAPGRAAWRAFGGPDAMVLYWVVLFPPALALSYLRALRAPLLAVAALYWCWAGLHAALGVPAPYIPW
jgi:hypothetical protein